MPNQNDYINELESLRHRLGDQFQNDEWIAMTSNFFYDYLSQYMIVNDTIDYFRDEKLFERFEPLKSNVSGTMIQLPNEQIYNEIIQYFSEFVITSESMLTKLNELHENYFLEMLKTIRNIDEPLSREASHKIVEMFKNEIDSFEEATEILDSETEKFIFEYLPFANQIKLVKIEMSAGVRYSQFKSIEILYSIRNMYLAGKIMPNLRKEYQKLRKVLRKCEQTIDLIILRQIHCAESFSIFASEKF